MTISTRLRGYLQLTRLTIMPMALGLSAPFLISYLIYHAQVGSVSYPHHHCTRTLYFVMLIPHSVPAAVMVPFILPAVRHALKGRFDRHTRITRILRPVWMFVSISGVVVYFMLYHLQEEV